MDYHQIATEEDQKNQLKKEHIKLIDKNGNNLLHSACNGYSLPLIKKLVNWGIDVNVKNKYGRVPLYYAVKRGRIEIVKYLVENGCKNISVLFALYRYHSPEILTYFVSKGWYKNIIDENGDSLLDLLLFRGHDITPLLILGNKINDEKGHPLHICARFNRLTSLKQLLKFVDTNDKDNKDNTPLHKAALVGNIKMCKILIENGCKPNTINKKGNTYSDILINRGYNQGEFKKQLYVFDHNDKYKNGIINEAKIYNHRINEVKENTQLMKACSINNFRLVKKYTTSETINKQNEKGWTALNFATIHGNNVIFDYLLSKGAKFSYTKSGSSFLHSITTYNHINLMKTLICHKFNLNVIIDTYIKGTALSDCILGNKIDLTKLLLNYGVEIDNVNCLKRTPLHYAYIRSNKYIIEKLKKIETNKTSELLKDKSNSILIKRKDYLGKLPCDYE